MTPSEKLELEACLKRVGEILYKDSNRSRLENLEDIETTVREQVLKHVSPQITFGLVRFPKLLRRRGVASAFLSSKKQELIKERKEQ